MCKETLIYLTFILGTKVFADGAGEPQTNVNFRTYLTNPIPIQVLVFQRNDYPELPPPNIPSGKGFLFVSLKDPVYSAVWQDDAFCIEPIIPAGFAVTNGNLIVTKRDLDWVCGATAHGVWMAKAAKFTSFPGALQKENIGVPVHDNALDYQRRLLEIAHMGIANLQNGSFKWSGDNWEGLTFSGAKITGRAFLDNAGERVTTVEYKVEGGRSHFKVEYSYDVSPDAGDTAPLLPHHFRRIQQTADPVHFPDLVEADFKIREIVLSTTAVEHLVVEREHKERGRIDALGTAPFFEATTQGEWYLARDGTRSLVEPTAHVQSPPGAVTTSRPRVAFYLLLFCAVGGLILIFQVSRQKKANTP